MVISSNSQDLPSLFRGELNNFRRKVYLNVDREHRENIYLQSIEGRAQQGHGMFARRAMPNISFPEVCHYCGTDPGKVLEERQQYVDRKAEFVDSVFERTRQDYTSNSGRPVYGLLFLGNRPLGEREAFLKGLVLGSFMDSHEYRAMTVNRYPSDLLGRDFRLGYGEELLIDTKELEKQKLTRTDLTRGVWTKDSLVDRHLYAPELRDGVENLFVRYSEGLGVCDDAAILTVGRIHGPSAMVGAFLADATDTYGKHVTRPVNGGIDEAIGRDVREKWKSTYGTDIVTDYEIMQLIFLAAKENFPAIRFSDSHRRFVQMLPREDRGGERSNRPTFLNHVNFLFGEDHDPDSYRYRLGFEGFWSPNFYKYMGQRWDAFERIHGPLETPTDSNYAEVLLN